MDLHAFDLFAGARLAALLLLASCGARAAEPLDAAAAEAFADAIIEPALAESGVPGAFIAIVKRDQTVLAKGYGVADRTTGAAVDPARTLFNIASIGKPMTALAALALAHEGQLDLDRDVNEYLGMGGRALRVTGGPLTLNHLLGHRAGFDANLSHLFVDLRADAAVSDAEINRRLVLLRRPGIISVYDNQGYGAIGLVLGAVTRLPFDRVLQNWVFAPLQMTQTRYVTPDAGGPELARCYVPLGPGVVKDCRYPVYRESLQGAGGVAATAEDLARFMRALLNRGRLDGKQAVPAELIEDLTDFDRYRFHPGLPGAARSFTEFDAWRRPEYAHSGHVPGFASSMHLYPAAGIGVMVGFLGGVAPSFDAVPSALLDYLLHYRPQSPEVSVAILRLELLPEAFRERFVPQRAAAIREAGGAPGPQQVPDPAGTYVPAAELSASLAGRLSRLVSALEVDVGLEGEVLLGERAYRPVGPDLYEDDRQDRLAFRQIDGQTYLATGHSAAIWEKRSALQAPTWTVPAFMAGMLLWPSWLVYLWRGFPSRTRRVAGLALAGFGLLLGGLLGELEYGVWVRIVKGAPWVALAWQAAIVAGMLAMLAAAVLGLRDARRARAVHALALLLAAGAMATALVLW